MWLINSPIGRKVVMSLSSAKNCVIAIKLAKTSRRSLYYSKVVQKVTNNGLRRESGKSVMVKLRIIINGRNHGINEY